MIYWIISNGGEPTVVSRSKYNSLLNMLRKERYEVEVKDDVSILRYWTTQPDDNIYSSLEEINLNDYINSSDVTYNDILNATGFDRRTLDMVLNRRKLVSPWVVETILEVIGYEVEYVVKRKVQEG